LHTLTGLALFQNIGDCAKRDAVSFQKHHDQKKTPGQCLALQETDPPDFRPGGW
jgi:hypothetical protein